MARPSAKCSLQCLSRCLSLPNLRDSSFVFPGKLTVISRHCLECRAEEEINDGIGVFIRMGIDIGFFTSRASMMDSTMVSILATTTAVLELGTLIRSSTGSIDGWRVRSLGSLQRNFLLMKEPKSLWAAFDHSSSHEKNPGEENPGKNRKSKSFFPKASRSRF